MRWLQRRVISITPALSQNCPLVAPTSLSSMTLARSFIHTVAMASRSLTLSLLEYALAFLRLSRGYHAT
jgi:hypothetical protein